MKWLMREKWHFCLFMVHSPCLSWALQVAEREKCWPFAVHFPSSLLDLIDRFQWEKTVQSNYGPLPSSVLGLVDWLAEEECKCIWSTACLPAGSWMTLEIHCLVNRKWCTDVDIMAGFVFQGLSSLSTWISLKGGSVCFSGLVSLFSVQGIILTILAVSVLLTDGRSFHFYSPFLYIHSHSLLSLFDWVYLCSHLVLVLLAHCHHILLRCCHSMALL